jgi:hypothetical protein
MTYRIALLAPTPAELDGLSECLVISHYENNYGGAARRPASCMAKGRSHPRRCPLHPVRQARSFSTSGAGRVRCRPRLRG